MERRLIALLVGGALLALAASTLAQQPTSTPIPVDPNAHISWPPPVYVLRDTVAIRGTANLPNMTSYFVEFRPLNEDLSVPDENGVWFPAMVPAPGPVLDDSVLGEWNTRTTFDGLYEIRLTINIAGRTPVFFRVSPIRVENNPPPWAAVASPTPSPTDTPASRPRPTLAPTPTPLDTTARVTALVDANVRVGDDVVYERVGVLLSGQTARIIGLSSFGSGWFYIEMDDGRRGWIAPSVARAEGNLSNLPRINPPPPPRPPATPTPVATPVPATTANLMITGFQLSPATPTCNQAFNVFINITNSGSQATLSGGTVLVEDKHTATGVLAATGSGTFPVLQPGANWVVVVPLTTNIFYAEPHTVTAVVDSLSQVPETNEADNLIAASYVLQKGSCP